MGLLASGKSKYGTCDSQKRAYTVWKILGSFRWLNFLGARFLLGLYCAIQGKWQKIERWKGYFILLIHRDSFGRGVKVINNFL